MRQNIASGPQNCKEFIDSGMQLALATLLFYFPATLELLGADAHVKFSESHIRFPPSNQLQTFGPTLLRAPLAIFHR
jgi:hypothetical protein